MKAMSTTHEGEVHEHNAIQGNSWLNHMKATSATHEGKSMISMMKSESENLELTQVLGGGGCETLNLNIVKETRVNLQSPEIEPITSGPIFILDT